MNAPLNEEIGAPFSIPTEHGSLSGSLHLRPGSAGLVVLAHTTPSPDGSEALLAEHFRGAGLSTLTVGLLTAHEAQFGDMHRNVPLLSRRLLDALEQIKYRVLLGEIALQPIGLYATNDTTPVAVRVAALRDHDIAALVCCGGLIDLAGVLYLHALESPLLALVDNDEEALISGARRALREVACRKELTLIQGIALAPAPGFGEAADAATRWFVTAFDGAR